MHGDRALNNHIGVLLRGFHLVKVRVQFVEAHLDAGTTRKLLALGALSWFYFATGVIFTTDLILICLNELGDHVPEQVHFLAGGRGKTWTQIFYLLLSFLLLFSNFVDDLRQTMLDVNEKNL